MVYFDRCDCTTRKSLTIDIEDRSSYRDLAKGREGFSSRLVKWLCLGFDFNLEKAEIQAH